VTFPSGPFLYGFQGRVGAVESAFHTSLESYRYGNQTGFAPRAVASLPTAVSSYVESVQGLNTFNTPRTESNSASIATDPVAPATLQGFYNESNLLTSGVTGTYSIGLTEECDPAESTSGYQSDLNSFDSAFGLTSTTLQFVATGTAGCVNQVVGEYAPNWRYETNLDIQWAHAMAPGAKINVCLDDSDPISPVNCDQYFYNELVNDGLYVPFISNSWSGSSPDDTLWYDLASEGVTLLSASGDSGAASGGSAFENWPAVNPYGLAVGGTTITTNGNSYGSEITWDDSKGGTGGGCTNSTYSVTQWQEGMDGNGYPAICNVPYPGTRDYPDVAADAGTPVYTYVNGVELTNATGTSLASPIWAGILNVVVQASRKPPQFETPQLYYLAETGEYSSVFHDITSGCNNFYCATTGYDVVTGLGTPNAGALASVFGGNAMPYWVGSKNTDDGIADVTGLNATLTVPSHAATSSPYAVLLGSYDSAFADSWDSVGLASYGSQWEIFYQEEASCGGLHGGGGVTSWTGNGVLAAGTAYNFAIQIASGDLKFSVAFATAPTVPIWSASYATSAAYFVVGDQAPCGSSWFPGWTNGEYFPDAFTAPPPFNFNFTGNQLCFSGTCGWYGALTSYYSPYTSPLGYPLASTGPGPALDGVAANYCGSSSYKSCTATLTTNNANDVIIAFCSVSSASLSGTIADTEGNSWTLRVGETADGARVYEYTTTASVALSGDQITCSTSSDINLNLIVYGVSGATVGAPFDPSGTVPAFTYSTSGGTPSVGVTLTNANDFLFGLLAEWVSGCTYATLGSSYSLLAQSGVAPCNEGEYERTASAGSGAFTVYYGSTGSHEYSLIADAIEAISPPNGATWIPYVDISQSSYLPSVTISNEVFGFSDDSGGSVTITRGSASTVTGTVFHTDPKCSKGCTVSLSASTALSGVTLSVTPSSGTANFTFSIKVTVSSTAACNDGVVTVYATSETLSPAEQVQSQFTVDIVGCGGGGCVANGSPILTPTGYVQVQKLTVGQIVIGYNLSQRTFEPERLLGLNETSVSSILSINDGQLLVTLEDQPLYVLNLSWTGWVRDPVNLSVGEQLFDPLTGAWMGIYSLSIVSRVTKVYDVVTSNPDDFIDDGLLLDKK
jgi:hypothetical protein